QELSWEACADYATTPTESELYTAASAARCARLTVPLDYSAPDGETASIAVMRIGARGESRGPLITNPGGPGGSGLMSTILSYGGLADSRITENFDMVGFDPRGVGASTPAIECFTDAERDRIPALGSQGTTTPFTGDDARALADRCAERSGGPEVLAHVGTRDAARDMDMLRAALGQEQTNYLGQSYGTRLGAVYAEQFPTRVRAMILDGAVDSAAGTFERRVGAYAGFQEAFDSMAAFCATEGDCPLGDDPSRATEVFSDLVQPLRDNPIPALGAELTFDSAVGGVIAGLYSPTAWPRIIAGVDEVRAGRGDELLQLSYDFSLRDPSGAWTNQNEANYAINCMDEERLTPSESGDLRAATFRDAPFMDPGVDVTRDVHDGCESWPVQPTLGYPYAQDIEGLPETLVVAFTADPTTPYEGGRTFAENLGASLLTVRGSGHTVVMAGTNPCVDEMAADYLIDLTTPPPGATCES
ncbi:alpha/beta hydrolase, partial [Rhodococcus rhodnii]